MYENDPKAVAWIEKYYERLKESPATRYRKKQNARKPISETIEISLSTSL